MQVITTRFVVDASELEASADIIREIEKDLDLAEGSAEKLTEEFNKQAKSIDQLAKEERELVKERNKSTDPKKIDRLNKEIRETRTQIKKLSGEYTRNAQSGKRGFGILQRAAQTLGPAIAAAFSVNVIKDFIASTIDAASRFEQTLTAFTTLLGGSREAAKKLIADLERLSLSTPLTPEVLQQSAKTLLSFGIAQEKILPTLQNLGDVAQGDSQKLQQLSLVFGQISSAGKLMGQDLLQLINVGFNPLQTISEKTGRSVSDLKKDMEKGLITFDRVEQAFKDATAEGGLFFGAMDAQSETFSGRVSTLEGNVDALKRQIGEQLLPVAGQLVELLLAMTQNAGALGEEFEFLSSLMDGLLFVLKAVTEEEKENAAVTEALGRVVENIISPVDGAISAFQDLERDLSAVTAELERVFEAVNDLFGLDIATPFKDAADAAERLEKRQAASAAQTEFLSSALERFKSVTSATDEEVAAFRKQFKGFDTDGMSTTEAVKQLGVEFGRFLDRTREAGDGTKAFIFSLEGVSKKISQLKEEQKKLNLSTAEGRARFFEINREVENLEKRLKAITSGTTNAKLAISETIETLDGFGAAAEIAAEFDPFKELPERAAKSQEEIQQINIEAAENIMALNRDLTQELVEEAQRRKQELISTTLETAAELITIFQEIGENRQQTEIDRLEERKQREIEAAGDSAVARKAIETRFNAEIEAEEKRLARIKQNNAIGQAIIDGALAATKILAQFGLPAAIPFLALAGAEVAGQIALIKSQKFATGVIDLQGPGSGTSDSIPAWLSRGESVMTAKETKSYLPTLKAMRAGFAPEILNHVAINGLTDRLIGGSVSVWGDQEVLKILKRQSRSLDKISKKKMRSGDVYISLVDGPKFNNRSRRKWN